MKTWHVLVTLGLMIALRLSDPFLLESSRLSFFDYLQRSHEIKQSEQIVLIDIDEETLEKFGQYPIPRETMADELAKLICQPPTIPANVEDKVSVDSFIGLGHSTSPDTRKHLVQHYKIHRYNRHFATS